MSKLIDALRKRYKNRTEALAALGLDASVLSDQPKIEQESSPMAKFTKEKEARVMSRASAWAQGFAKARMMAHDSKSARDDEPDEQFEREQLAGEDDDIRVSPGTIERIVELLGGEDDPVAKQIRSMLDNDMSTDESGRLAALRAFLEENSNLSDDEIEEALKCARTDMGADEPPDLPYGAMPVPGGKLTRARPDGSGNSTTEVKPVAARDQAMALVRRIGVDTSVATQHFTTPAVNTHGRLAADTSTKVLASFAARFPEVARIRQA